MISGNAIIQSSANFSIDRFRGRNFTLDKNIYTSFNQASNTYTSMLGEKSETRKGAFHVNLFHEIGHTWLSQTFSGDELDKKWVKKEDFDLTGDITQSEIAASYIENMLRSEQGLPLRMSYSPDAQSASTLINSTSIKLSSVQLGFGINFKNRVFTMPNDVQIIYNKIMNSKK